MFRTTVQLCIAEQVANAPCSGAEAGRRSTCEGPAALEEALLTFAKARCSHNLPRPAHSLPVSRDRSRLSGVAPDAGLA